MNALLLQSKLNISEGNGIVIKDHNINIATSKLITVSLILIQVLLTVDFQILQNKLISSSWLV